MIEIDIPAIDPIQHEPKIFVGMSARQCLCIVPGVALGVGAYYLFSKLGSTDLAFIGAITFILPAILMGWCKPYNMKFEQYIQLLYFNTFVSNPKRIYKTDNEEERKLMTMKQLEEQAKKEEAAKQQKEKTANKKGKAKPKKEAK